MKIKFYILYDIVKNDDYKIYNIEHNNGMYFLDI